MHEFEYVAPTSLADAVAAFGKSQGQAKLLAGGTDLIDQMRMGRHTPALIVDVKKIPEMMRGLGSGIKEFKDAVKEEDKKPEEPKSNSGTTN